MFAPLSHYGVSSDPCCEAVRAADLAYSNLSPSLSRPCPRPSPRNVTLLNTTPLGLSVEASKTTHRQVRTGSCCWECAGQTLHRKRAAVSLCLVSRCGLAVRRYAGKQKDLGSIRFGSPLSSEI